MARIVTSFEELIGHTPLVELTRLEFELRLRARLLAKVEFFNPSGSVKDRAALYMIRDARARGLLKKGSVIIEPTSGNTGIGLAAVAAVFGYRTILVMPDTMSEERRALLAAYGAELVLTEGSLGMAGAIAKAEEIARETPGSFMPGQFTNPANVQAHYETTGPEIWKDTRGKVDVLVAGVGTGGTITGTGRYLKEQKPAVRLVAVEPADSPVLLGGVPGPHGLQGIGAGFVPEILDRSLLDEVIPVTTVEAYAAARMLVMKEGLLTGISSGAALHAAISLAEKDAYAGHTIVVILPDAGDRYLSTALFKEDA